MKLGEVVGVHLPRGYTERQRMGNPGHVLVWNTIGIDVN